MTELIDLTKVLKVGDKVWDIIRGEQLCLSGIVKEENIAFLKFTGGFTRSIYGQYFTGDNYPNAEQVIFPSKTQRNWQKYIDDKAEEQKRADLLAEAKRRYPIGTFISTDLFVTGEPYWDRDLNWSICVFCNKIYERSLYRDGEWIPIKPKRKLFTTEDGVDIFKGDQFVSIRKTNFLKFFWTADETYGKNKDIVWYFSTKEAADKFIAEEKGRRLLEEAKLRYPVRTQFISSDKTTNKVRISSSVPYMFGDEIRVNILQNADGFNSATIYNGLWGQIISSPYADCKSSPFTTEQENWIKNQINLNNRRDKCE